MDSFNSPQDAVFEWMKEKINEMTVEELARFHGVLLANDLLRFSKLIDKLEKRDRA